MQSSINDISIKPHLLPRAFLEDMIAEGFTIYKDKIIIVNCTVKEDLMNIIDLLNWRQLDNLIAIHSGAIYIRFVWKDYIPIKYRTYKRKRQFVNVNNKAYEILLSVIYPW